jgi:hypothetical protein
MPLATQSALQDSNSLHRCYTRAPPHVSVPLATQQLASPATSSTCRTIRVYSSWLVTSNNRDHVGAPETAAFNHNDFSSTAQLLGIQATSSMALHAWHNVTSSWFTTTRCKPVSTATGTCTKEASEQGAYMHGAQLRNPLHRLGCQPCIIVSCNGCVRSIMDVLARRPW